MYYKNKVVRASQPPFLLLIIFGCWVSSATMIAISVDDSSVDYSKTPYMDMTERDRQRVYGGVNFACQIQPYLYGIVFAITFSSLYAKIARVLRIFNVGSRTSTLKRAPVKIQDMVAYQAVSILFEFGVCFVWHMMNPLVWNRQVMCVQYEEREDGGKK